jgi:SAM-dependent methyltransferase
VDSDVALKGALSDRLRWTLNWQSANLMPLLRQEGAEQKLFDFWATTRRMADVLALTGLGEGSLSVDVGGGLTTPLRWFPGRRVCADPLASHYSTLFDLPTDRVEFVSNHGEALPMTDASVDLVVCTNCIDHVADPVGVIGEIERVLRPGGWFWFSCEIKPLGAIRNAGHPHAMDREAVGDLIARFDVVLAWEEPWRGLHRFMLGKGPKVAVELGFLVRRMEGPSHE